MKCPQCGLVNFSTESSCKRCGAPLPVDSEAASLPNTINVWRDSALLVLAGNSVLPMRCLRCNAASSVSQRIIKIDYFPKYNLATWVLAGFLHWKRFTLGLPLCRRHNLGRAISTALGILLIFVGIGLVVASIGYNWALLYYPGFFVLISGFLVVAFKGNPISVQKFDSPYLWLRGIDKDYLAPLPQWRKL